MKKTLLFLSAAAILSSSLITGTAQAAPQGWQKPVVRGQVTAINGNSLTVSSTSTAYTVDATNATVVKGFGPNTATSSISAIQTGDTVSVMGAVSGTTVTATTIHDGVGPANQDKAIRVNDLKGENISISQTVTKKSVVKPTVVKKTTIKANAVKPTAAKKVVKKVAKKTVITKAVKTAVKK